MDRQVGVVREAATLAAAARQLGALAERDGDNLSLIALMVAEAALRREESRGGHFRSDFLNPFSTGRHAEIALADVLPEQAERQVA